MERLNLNRTALLLRVTPLHLLARAVRLAAQGRLSLPDEFVNQLGEALMFDESELRLLARKSGRQFNSSFSESVEVELL